MVMIIDQLGNRTNAPRVKDDFEILGRQRINVQHHPNLDCEMSADPEGAVMAVFSVQAPRVVKSYVNISMMRADEVFAAISKDGISPTKAGLDWFQSAGVTLKPNAGQTAYHPALECKFVGWWVPVDNRSDLVVEATLVQPATVNLTTAAARFVKTLATALSANGSEIDVDGAKVIAAPRSATLGLYSVQHDNADTARRVHDRDLDAAIEAGAVRREPHDGETWLFLPRPSAASDGAFA